jgi:serine/threonine protein kinase/WD40 repeat protein
MSATSPAPRATIGPYRIIARVGAGGMGEVFKAWDPRLEREVAIKLLHADVAGDAVRQKRLLAEGRAASALNHPNILRVYDADVDGDSYYLVSEWLEGKSLRDELGRGSLSIRRLLDLAVQIADGLAAAHAIGIVHRDIKPENIMLARDGTARIVDFGLARSDPHAPATMLHATHAATVSLEGGLSGTPGYMSPEQARGQAGDLRTDQFSFGSLLYEMATGRQAFRRDTIADTLAAVLHEEPRPIADLNPRIPAPVRWTIERCLAKDPADRYSATDDLARELRWIRDRLSETFAEPRPIEEAAPQRRRLKLAGAVAVAVIAGAVAALAWSSQATDPPSVQFVPFASASSYEGEPSWSPDGQSIAYAADVNGVLQVFVKRLGDALSRQLTEGQFDASHPFWTRNGDRVYYISQAGEYEALWSVGVAGGRPELELENVARAAIDSSGTRLALLRADPDAALRQTLWWSSPPGAAPQREMRPPFDQLRTGGDGLIRFSGDNQLMVWMYDVDTINSADPARASGFYLVPEGSQPVRQVLTTLLRATNVPLFDWWDNRHAIVALRDPIGGNRHLWIADTQTATVRQITSGHTNETAPAVAPSGAHIAYASEEVDFDLTLITPDGRSRSTLLATARNEFDPTWSPSGDQFAFVTDRSGSLEIWTRSRDGQWERPIVTTADFGSSRSETLASLSFSPDGRTLAYQRGAEGTWDIWLSPVTGGTPVRLTTTTAGTSTRPWRDAPTWSPDGEWVAFMDNEAGRNALVKARVGTSETVELMRGTVPFSRPAWSPDGRWIATQNDEGLVRIPAGGGKPEPIVAMPILGVTWRPDGRSLVALTESETPGHFALAEIDAASGDARLLNPDLGSIPIANQPIRGLSFLPGQGFLTSLASARSDIWLVEGFEPPRLGWFGWFRR